MMLRLLLAILVGIAALAAEDLRCDLVFDAQPTGSGLSFDRAKGRPGTVAVRGQPVAVWSVLHGSDPQRGWGRTLRLRVDDPRFRDGRMPVADIEVEFQQTQRVGVDLWADTAAGMRQLGRVWGGDAALRTLRCRVDDARFAAVDGVDLRLQSANADLQVRSVRIRGYDRKQPDWRRLLRPGPLRGGPDAFLFAAGDRVALQLPLDNLALVGFAGSWEAVQRRPDGSEAARSSGAVSAAPGATGTIPLEAVAAAPFGVHRIDLALRAADGSPVAERTVAFAVAATAMPLAKASPGAFLYGLDVRNGEIHTQPAYLAWLGLLGIDIVRGGAVLDRLGEAMQVYRAHRVQVMAMADIHWNADEGRRRDETARLAELAERTARENPDVVWWELGNEPDLTGFYAGPIEAYLAQAAQVAAAVRRGNPAARTMNGGLAFHGREGDERARRLVARFADGGFDGIAYHGHGPGAAAERLALERLRGAMADAQVRPGFVIDTETGVAAVAKPAQELVQARTVVQKLVYGQAEGLPMMFWFRLHFESPEAYGNVVADDPRQPRPVLVALRSVVERLRDLRCIGRLDLGGRDLAAYAFAAADGRERRLVLWSEDGAERTVAFVLGAAGDAMRHDLFGNPSVPQRTGEVTAVDIGPDPVVLSWRAADPAVAPRAVEPPLALAGDAALAPGRAATLRVHVRNPTAQAVRGRASLRVVSATPVNPVDQAQPVELPPGGSADLAFAVRALPGSGGVTWPERWSVFTGVDPAAGDPALLTAIPATLPGEDGRAVVARSVAADDDVLDFASLHGSLRERRLAIAVAEVVSDAERSVPILAGADWWMSWAVNGRPVYDTLAAGNGGAIDPPGHSIVLPLRAGRNLVAVAVQSGSMGWRLLAAGPERSLRLSGGVRERIVLELEADGAVWASAVAPLRQLARPARCAGELMQGAVQDWRIRPGATRLAEAAIVNLWEAHPDRRNWWQGDADLSARVWLVQDAAGLGVVAEVHDDVHRAGDGLRIALSRDGRTVAGDWLVADGVATPLAAEVWRDEGAAITWYRVALGRQEAGPDGLLINVLVEDDDRGERKQYLRLRPGLGGAEALPAAWLRMVVE